MLVSPASTRLTSIRVSFARHPPGCFLEIRGETHSRDTTTVASKSLADCAAKLPCSSCKPCDLAGHHVSRCSFQAASAAAGGGRESTDSGRFLGVGGPPKGRRTTLMLRRSKTPETLVSGRAVVSCGRRKIATVDGKKATVALAASPASATLPVSPCRLRRRCFAAAAWRLAKIPPGCPATSPCFSPSDCACSSGDR